MSVPDDLAGIGANSVFENGSEVNEPMNILMAREPITKVVNFLRQCPVAFM